jgi:alpha,alpha-trehalase
LIACGKVAAPTRAADLQRPASMRAWSLCVGVALSCLPVLTPVAARAPATAPPQERVLPPTPQIEFGDLFTAVQMGQLYSDNKAFADAVPRGRPDQIVQQFQRENPRSGAALRRFVNAHFTLPADAGTAPSAPEHVPIVVHIDQLWDVLTRRTPSAPPFSSLLPVPEPYIVPGGRFREMYYWDSYFTLLGLKESGRQDLVRSMVKNFAWLIDTYGHIPNGLRTYYVSRSQPPFFFAMVGLLAARGEDGSTAYAEYLPQLQAEYAFWMDGAEGLQPGQAHRRAVALADGSVLNRYWDDVDSPRDESYEIDSRLARTSGRVAAQLYRDVRAAAESGWDFSSRWFEDGKTRSKLDTTGIIPVDLNSLLLGLENAIRVGCQHRGDSACTTRFTQQVTRRRAAMDHYLWNEAAGYYMDYRWSRQIQQTRISAATVYPLFVHAASAGQAGSVAMSIAKQLLKEGGLVTTTEHTGEQWDSPNGWAPLQWLAIAGLRQYGKEQLAGVLACRWIVNVNEVYAASGKLVEKYDVVTTGRKGGGGEYPLQDGFGWTNGVMRALLSQYPAYAALTRKEQCPALAH